MTDGASHAARTTYARAIRLVRLAGTIVPASRRGGVTLGFCGSFAATRLITGMLFDVPSTDLSVFVVVTLALLGSGFLACLLPARRATRMPAVEALKAD